MNDLFFYLPNILSNIWLYGILAIVVINVIVFIHEMGHYLMGRATGIRAELFCIGFGREMIGRTDKNGTRWSLRFFPLGGYVRFAGEHITPDMSEADLREAYASKPVWRRSLVAAAGPAMNLLFSFLLLTGIYMVIGRPTPPPVVAGVEVGSPAEEMGIQIGDLILSIDGRKISGIDQAREYVRDKIGKSMVVEVERNNAVLAFTGAPKQLNEKNEYGFNTPRGYFGWMWPVYGLEIKEIHAVAGQDTKGNPDKARQLLLANADKDVIINFGRDRPVDYRVHMHPEFNKALTDSTDKDYSTFTLSHRPIEYMRSLPPGQAADKAGVLIKRAIHSTFGSFFQVIAGTKHVNEFGGVIKIGATTGKMFERGLHTFLTFMALLSVSIGVFNLLPIPMLDGGHLLFYLMEAIKGSPVSLRTKGYIYGFGLIFLLMAIIVINVNDLISVFNF